MKISNNNVEKLLQSYTRQVENKKNSKAKSSDSKDFRAANITQRTDSVTISSRSDEVRKAKELYNELPDVRRELVSELKEKIRSGEYEVSSKDLADKIMHRAIVDGTV
jgi:negative regulator of flagellin synthesis FlgM